MRAVADTGPIVAAANRRDRAHRLSAELVTRLGSQLIVPVPVLTEVDQLLRSRLSARAARAVLAALGDGTHALGVVTEEVHRRAVEIDRRYADLDLGYADAVVMAIADRERLPVLTYDFTHFRATSPESSPYWQLVVDESRYRDNVT